MATRIDEPAEPVHWLAPEDGRAFFDAEVRQALGISGTDFLRGWDAGEYDAAANDAERPEIMRLAVLIPFGR